MKTIKMSDLLVSILIIFMCIERHVQIYGDNTSDSKAWAFCGRMGELITPAGHVNAPDHWSAEECIAFNSKQLRDLEENYERSFQMPMLIPPFMAKQQLALLF